MRFFCASCTTPAQVCDSQAQSLPIAQARALTNEERRAETIAAAVFEILRRYYPLQQNLLRSFITGLTPVLVERSRSMRDWEVCILKDAPGDVFNRATSGMDDELRRHFLNLFPTKLFFGIRNGFSFSHAVLEPSRVGCCVVS